jgi:hypothetical protein
MAERKGGSRGNVMVVDSSMDWERRLSYKEKEAGWIVFRYLYWGLYVFVVGCMLVIAGLSAPNVTVFVGWAVIILAVFLVVYGFVESLHHRLMRKHG